jgi:SAM-dependent methyltransferase
MGETSDQSRFWDAAAAARQFAHPIDLELFAARVPRDARILDYGCGQGRLCGELAAHGFTRLLGVDSSPEMIRLARERNPGIEFSVVDGQHVPCEDASVDAALLFAVLTCIPETDSQRELVAGLRRALRPGGLLVISDYPLQADARNLERYARFAHEPDGYGAFRLPDGARLRHHRREWFDELLEGFRAERTVEIDARTMNGNPARILQLWATR